MAGLSVLFFVFYFLHAVLAAPSRYTSRRRAVTAVSSSDLAALAPFTQFARATYCSADKLKGWKCGEACDAVPDFVPSLVGGDGNAVQTFFVGHYPKANTIIVAHEGTDPTALLSDLTDIEVLRGPLNATFFPGISSDVEVHDGFRNEHEKTASQILAEVQSLLKSTGSKSVTLVGHSLGGALAELDALFMTYHLPANVAIKGVTYGTPRVGNPAFATLFDSKVADFKRVNNEADIVPIVPGRFLGFAHPHGEVHIVSPGKAIACSGDDDASDAQCQISTVPNILEGNILNHLGPYEGIFLGTLFC